MDSEVESKKEIEKNPQGIVKRWIRELDLAKKRDKLWCEDAKEALRIYSNEAVDSESKVSRKETFNIFWSNVETKRPALYNSIPRPDIRRRNKDKSPVAKAVSELTERCAKYIFEAADLHRHMQAAVNDCLIPGRGITRVKYVPVMGQEPVMTYDEMGQEVPQTDENGEPVTQDVILSESVEYEQVQWDRFRTGPGRNWDEIPWVAFMHEPSKDEAKEKWPEYVEKLSFTNDGDEEDDGRKQTEDSDIGLFSTTTVWEIWDKESKKVIWIAECYKDSPLDILDDPLEMVDFWPIPRPLYAIQNPTSIVPQTEYSMYSTLAKEVEEACNRIRRILKGIRVRGVYDSRVSEIEKLFDEDDNGFVPAENVEQIMEHGLSNAIWMLPIQEIVAVLQQLYQYRQDLIHQIYEITGISDIIRGSSNPHETLGAQRIKANYGSQRLSNQQEDVQRYARDLLRLTVELICRFQRDTLVEMSGMNFPTMMEKQQAQQAAQMAQQMQQEVPPQMAAILNKPTWEEIEQVLSNDISRNYLIDIETNSTVQVDQQEEQKNIAALLTAIVQYFQAIGPAIQAGAMDKEAAIDLLLTFVHSFGFGRKVEEAFENSKDKPQPPDPEQMKQQQEQERAQQEAQQQMQLKQIDLQMKQMEAQQKKQQMEREEQYQAAEHQRNMEKLHLERQELLIKHQIAMEEMQMKKSMPATKVQ